MRFARPVLLLLAAALPLGVAAAAWHHAGPRSSRSSRAAALRQQLPAAPPLPEEGHEIEVRCERVAYGGLGIARTDAGATVMLSDHTVPGELIRALVTRRRRRHVEARTTAVLEPGPASVAPPWSELFASCGGCQLQRMAYAEQLATKRRWVIDAIARCPGGAAAVLSRASPAHASGMGHSATALAAAALEPIVRATVPSPKQTRYRNKATFFFAPSDSGLGLVVGSKAADDAGRVVPIGGEGCPLQAEEADAVLASVAAWARRTALPSFDIRSGRRGEGALWQAVLRTAGGGAGGGAVVQLELVTAGAASSAALAALSALAASLLEAHEPLVRVLHTEVPVPPPPDTGVSRGRRRQRRGASPDACAEAVAVLAARGGGDSLAVAVQRPGGGAPLRFEVPPRGFWQVNDGGTDLLVRLVADGVALGLASGRGNELPVAAHEAGREGGREEERRPVEEAPRRLALVDLYCGSGLFGVSLAATTSFASVLGLELGAEAVAAAEANAAANGVGALCRFEAADLAFSGRPPAGLAAALAPGGVDLVVVVDPPRAGLSGAMRGALRRSTCSVLVYVSCDAQTLGRDLAALCGAEGAGTAFRLARATPVDLTPHAARVETVCVLSRA